MGKRRTVYFSEEAESDIENLLDLLRRKHAPLKVSLSEAIGMAVKQYYHGLMDEMHLLSTDDEPSHE